MKRSRIGLKVIACLGLSLCLSSCGSGRQVSDTSVNGELIGRMEAMIREMVDRRIVEVRTSDIMTDIVVTRREFDATGEVDPSTGERPVSSRTDTHVVIGRRDSVMVADSVSAGRDTGGVVDLRGDVDVRSRDVDHRMGPGWAMAVTLMSILGILVVSFVILKRFNVIK